VNLDPEVCAAALEAIEKIIQKNASRVHGNLGVGSIFKVLAVYQEKPRKNYKPPNYLSAPPPNTPENWLSNLSIYKMRTAGGWILPPNEERGLLFLARLDNTRKNRPDLAELDKNHISPPRRWWYQFPQPDGWEKRWRRDRARGIWPAHDPRTWSFRWAKNALALHFHKAALDILSKYEWQREGRKPIKNPALHLRYDDRVAAAMLGLAEAINRFNEAEHTNGLYAYAIWWIRKELQRLARNARLVPWEDHESYGFGKDEFGPGLSQSFRPRVHPLVSYDENSYRRRPQFVNIGDCVVENIKLGAPADDNDDVEHVGQSFATWSPVNPETTLLFKEAAWEKYKYRSAAEIAQMCDNQIDAATVRAMRDDWRAKQKRNRFVMSAQPIKALAAFDMVALPASVFAAV
jgi:hypothetical protein